MYVNLGGAPKREDFVGLTLEVARRLGLPTSKVVELLARCERSFTEALSRHVADEEESLPPRLRARSAAVDAGRHAHAARRAPAAPRRLP